MESKKHRRPQAPSQKTENSTQIVESKDAKFRLTFLIRQSFRGEWYDEGATIEVAEDVCKAYQKRKTLKFERI